MLSLVFAAALSTASAEEVTDYSAEWRAVLAERRAANIERLADYAEAGRYPLNLTQPGPAHMFMDGTGSRCGMAELIWQSGHEQLVVDAYQLRNDVVMAELGLGDPLTEWVAVSGLTMAEVAFIQEPGFMVGMMEEPLEPEPFIAQVDPELLELETARRTAHFGMAARQLSLTTERSLDQALLALGERVLEPPPAESWASQLPHSTAMPVAAPTRNAKRRTRG
ncbi:MAG: hypothetical protein EP330_05035 [Deltaproteobacteria bacterium]|nr:MAG: hypothetical protein EP330_05035 [Deltaproteobacteria bacterium]